VRSRALELGLALLLDEALGDPPDRWHPVAWFGSLAERVEARLWRDDRAHGVLFVVGLVGLAWAVGAVLEAVPAGGVLAAWVALGGRTLRRRSAEVADLLERGDLDGARDRLGWLVGRERGGLGPNEVARAAIESVAENTADAVLGVLVWHLVAGPRGSLAFRAINTLDAMVGHRSTRYERFGWAAARADDWAVWPAARLAWLLERGVPRRLVGAARAHPSPNAGLMEALCAHAVGTTLGGVNRYDERVVRLPELVAGPPPDAAALRRAVGWSKRSAWRAVAVLGVLEWLGRLARTPTERRGGDGAAGS